MMGDDGAVVVVTAILLHPALLPDAEFHGETRR